MSDTPMAKKVHNIKDKSGRIVGYTREGVNGALLIYLKEFNGMEDYFHGETSNFQYYCVNLGWDYHLEKIGCSMFTPASKSEDVTIDDDDDDDIYEYGFFGRSLNLRVMCGNHHDVSTMSKVRKDQKRDEFALRYGPKAPVEQLLGRIRREREDSVTVIPKLFPHQEAAIKHALENKCGIQMEIMSKAPLSHEGFSIVTSMFKECQDPLLFELQTKAKESGLNIVVADLPEGLCTPNINFTLMMQSYSNAIGYHFEIPYVVSCAANQVLMVMDRNYHPKTGTVTLRETYSAAKTREWLLQPAPIDLYLRGADYRLPYMNWQEQICKMPVEKYCHLTSIAIDTLMESSL